MQRYLNKLSAFFANEDGVTLVEYGVAISLAVLVGSSVFISLNGEIRAALAAAGLAMPG